jgi:adiponectin receptor
VSLIPKFDAPKYRKFRAILFVIVGLSSAIPGVHIIFFRNKALSPQPPVFLLALGGALYIIGAAIYGTRIPERFFKGKVNLIF